MWDDENTVFVVVLNDEEQFSIWPQAKPIPAGWRTYGFEGSKSACLDHIGEVWTDMRPKSVRTCSPL
jgi:MbtH protein